jgi:hypothetical protein
VFAIKMDPKKMLSKEISTKVKGHINEETISETVNQFFRHGNTFLLLELISLKREVKSLREELQRQRDNEEHSFHALVVP